MARKKPKKSSNTIVSNKKARHDYFIEENYEAGVVLEGWEVKSLREGKAQLVDSYVLLKNGEAFLLGSLITPLLSASTHINPEPTRTRKLLLHRDQINKLVALVDRKGYAVIALSLYWKRGRVKADIGIAKGKKDYDKRAVQKDRDWKRDKQRILKHG
ncbi:MAG TPA: SsrA-binding protein SmpB [Gammaproteobacteria bacterium]|nr:SsrA-binding protein SmpB [Gammaproteobacteria bacterium]